MNTHRCSAAPCCVFAALAIAAGSSPARSVQQPSGPLELMRITPAGAEVPAGAEIVLQFDRPMVPLGRMERSTDEVPVAISPPLPCEWRWLDTSALACRLPGQTTFAAATRYDVRIENTLTARDGSRLATNVVHHFSTRRPAIERVYLREWKGPAWPQLLVFPNQRFRLDSLAQKLWLRDDRGARTALTVVPDPDRAGWWLAEPAAELGADRPVTLVLDQGLVSEEGPLPGEASEPYTLHTFPEPGFVGVACTNNAGLPVRLRSSRELRKCSPLRGVELEFSAPVAKEDLAPVLRVTPDLAGGRTDYDPWEQVESYSQRSSEHRAGATYSLSLPWPLRAGENYRLRAPARRVRDEFGRFLTDGIDFTFSTDHRPPNAVLTHPVSVLERGVATHVPLVVTNLERVPLHYTMLTAGGVASASTTLELARAPDVAYAVPLEARRWLGDRFGDRSGVVLGQLDLPSDVVAGSPHFHTQVTPFQVHAKLGHRNTLVWVTDLASGQPVEGATVSLYIDNNGGLVASPPSLSRGTTDGSGVVLLEGTDTIDPDLVLDRWYNLFQKGRTLFARVEKDGELALLPLQSDFQVEALGPNDSWIARWAKRRFGHLRAFGATAQGVYRLGSTIDYKIWVRDEENRELIEPPSVEYQLRVVDPQGKEVHSMPSVRLSEFGAFHGSFTVPENGVMGWYNFELRFSSDQRAQPSFGSEDYTWQPMQVLVSDFTPAPFRVTTDLNADRYVASDRVDVATTARLHSGGPYGSAAARLVARVLPLPIASKDPRIKGFWFETTYGADTTVFEQSLTLDPTGAAQATFTLDSAAAVHGRLEVESGVRDDRGKQVAGRTTARYHGRDRYVGILQPDWVLEVGKPATVEARVLDARTDSVEGGVPVVAVVEYLETKAARVKGAGNAYLTQYSHTWLEVTRCAADSTPEQPTRCSFVPERPGSYRMTATITDRAGRLHSSATSRWAIGAGAVMWETPPGHYLPVEPEKTEVEVGQKARFLIRNPFPGAHALFTVERLGVQRHWTQVLANATEVVELDVLPEHVPGFYFSVVVTSPRVEPPPAERGEEDGTVDLGKPAMRVGYARLEVVDPYKRIDVQVTSDKPVYRPRERARVELLAKPAHPRPDRSEPIELAVAVLDESVFDLLHRGRDTFDPYRGFYSLDPLDVDNFNLLTHLIGIQKFEKKGANPGGDGLGPGAMRSVFRYVAYWNPSLRTDADGRAAIELELPDPLTGWRVLAMAVTPSDRMGLGEGNFVTNQPIELRPALPNQVIEGDTFTARFTVMNRTEQPQRLVLQAKATGPAEAQPLDRTEIEAAPFVRYPVAFSLKALRPGTIDLALTATADRERDALRVPLVVERAQAPITVASYGTTTDTTIHESLEIPKEIRSDVGAVSVVLSPSVVGNVAGAFQYARDYPYLCWEQRLTKAVLARHYLGLRSYAPADFAWPDAETWVTRTLEHAANFQAPNGGMAYWVPRDEYASPYLSAYTALGFAWLASSGHPIPAGVEGRLHTYLDGLLRGGGFPTYYTDGMASSVRAVALAALALRDKLAPTELDRTSRALDGMSLFGKAHFLLAADRLGRSDLAAEAERQIMNHVDQTGGKIELNESLDGAYAHMHTTAQLSTCAVLSALVANQDGAPAGTGIGDVPFRLVRAITQTRGRRDHGETTQENVFCVNGLVDYSRVYEREPVAMTVTAALDGRTFGRQRFGDLRDGAATLERRLTAADPGRTAVLSLERAGSGRLYYASRLTYSPLDLSATAINAGIDLVREYSVRQGGGWQRLPPGAALRRGDLVRVDLFVTTPAARHFVVVDDPVPGGLEPVNRDLATASRADADAADRLPQNSTWYLYDDWQTWSYEWSGFYHRELGHRAARFFSDYLGRGRYHLSYAAQVIADGDFQALPAKAEEMYDPDVFGRSSAQRFVVRTVESPVEAEP